MSISQTGNSTDSYSYLTNTQTTSQTSDVTSQTEKSQQETSSASEVKISSRAQKLAALQEEFFPGGYKSLSISSSFIARLQEYGFISEQQVGNLPEHLQPGSEASSSASNTTETVAKVMAKAESLLERLEGEDKHLALQADIADALDVLESDFGRPSTHSRWLSEQLDSHQQIIPAEDLTQEEWVTLSGLSSALKINDLFSSGTTNNQLGGLYQR
ncbi:hypothetical protein R50073_17700 [Maricurvus nonylphenolicus]|uniref:hypothetical protein n=1 Tax=Maricurvus nonylphenolicus TaxID=1008307 RepID=UPI0036F1E15A